MGMRARHFVKPTAAVLAMMPLLAGCNVSQSSSSTKASTTDYTIRMYAGGFTPIKPTKLNPDPPTALQTLAKQYEKIHPNIKIKFVTEPLALGTTYNDYAGWLTTQGDAGTAPDIVWDQWLQVNGGFVPKGFFTNLAPYLKQPDPYVSGNKHWGDLFNPVFQQELTNQDGSILAIDGDYVDAALVYNKSIFKKVGIKTLPTTFADLTSDLMKIKQAGFIPLAYDLSDQTGTSWWERMAATEFLQPDIAKFNVDHQTSTLSPLDYAVGIERGYIQMTNPRYAEVWKLLKQFSNTWDSGSTQITNSPPAAGNSLVSSLQLVAQGKAAVAWAASSSIPWLNNSGFSKVYGVLPFPVITKATSPYSANLDVQAVVGGPNGNFQYFVPTQKANHTLTPDKLKWVINWLQFIATPQNSAKVVDQVGGTVPTMVGAKATNKDLLTLIPTKKVPLSVGSFNLDLGAQATDDLIRLVQAYITNQLSYDAFASQFDTKLQNAAAAWAAQNNVDLSKYKTK